MRASVRPSSVMRRIACAGRAAAYSSSSKSSAALDVEEMKRRPAKVIYDYLTPTPSRLLDTLLCDLLGEQPASLSGGTTETTTEETTTTQFLPQGHHLVYFPLQTPASRLAADGADADHAPGPEFTRRLWAGGEVVFRPRGGDGDGDGHGHGHVLDGRAWVCREKIEDVRVRGGGGGGGVDEKVFVDVWRRYAAAGKREWDIEERRTLVFMRKPEEEEHVSAASASSLPPRLIKYSHPPTHASPFLLPTPHHLFHFSALTYNAHAIHLDPLHARRHDGHRALLVHGPLTLALMLRVLAAAARVAVAGGGGGGREVASIAYRNYAPLYVGERARVCVRRVRRGGDGGDGEADGDGGDGEQTWDVWVEGPEGGLAVKGTAVVRVL